MDQDEFGNAADAVNRPQTVNGEDRSVTIEYERRKYPPCPIGMFPAICVKAEIKDANPNGQFYQEGDKRIHLRWQVIEPTYKDDQNVERHYSVFSRPLPVSFGPRSHMYKLWLKLTGTDVNQFLTKVPVKIPLGNGKTKDVLRLTFEHILLENMKANIVVEHQMWEGEMRPNLANYIVNDDQRATNYRQLPGMANATLPPAPSTPSEPTAAPVQATAPTPPAPTMSAVPDTPLYKSPIDPKDLPF